MFGVIRVKRYLLLDAAFFREVYFVRTRTGVIAAFFVVEKYLNYRDYIVTFFFFLCRHEFLLTSSTIPPLLSTTSIASLAVF